MPGVPGIKVDDKPGLAIVRCFAGWRLRLTRPTKRININVLFATRDQGVINHPQARASEAPPGIILRYNVCQQ